MQSGFLYLIIHTHSVLSRSVLLRVGKTTSSRCTGTVCGQQVALHVVRCTSEQGAELRSFVLWRRQLAGSVKQKLNLFNTDSTCSNQLLHQSSSLHDTVMDTVENFEKGGLESS